MEHALTGSVGVTFVQGALVVTVTRDLGDGVLGSIRQAALDGVHRMGARRVVLDLGAVPFLDLEEFEGLRHVAHATGLLGAETVMVGLRPGIIMHLIGAGADTRGVRATLELSDALGRGAGAGDGP